MNRFNWNGATLCLGETSIGYLHDGAEGPRATVLDASVPGLGLWSGGEIRAAVVDFAAKRVEEIIRAYGKVLVDLNEDEAAYVFGSAIRAGEPVGTWIRRACLLRFEWDKRHLPGVPE